MSWGNILINFTRHYLLILCNLDLKLLVGDNSTKNGALWNNDKLSYNCLKMRCSGKMAPPYENRVNPHSQQRQNFSSGPGTSNFWTLVSHRQIGLMFKIVHTCKIGSMHNFKYLKFSTISKLTAFTILNAL